mmetsp:Transcript_7636/g.19150  ORF Transcript_7636/g.19150 Transcript_7636/m.19150 type:complete len:203 (+) Transcript_7636:1068-1676(+)
MSRVKNQMLPINTDGNSSLTPVLMSVKPEMVKLMATSVSFTRLVASVYMAKACGSQSPTIHRDPQMLIMPAPAEKGSIEMGANMKMKPDHTILQWTPLLKLGMSSSSSLWILRLVPLLICRGLVLSKGSSAIRRAGTPDHRPPSQTMPIGTLDKLSTKVPSLITAPGATTTPWLSVAPLPMRCLRKIISFFMYVTAVRRCGP